MMHGFDDVTIRWQGQDYVAPAKGMLELLTRLEHILAGDSGRQALNVLMQPEGPPYTRLARCYGAALRYAGAAHVTDEAVYLWIVEDLAAAQSTAADIQSAIWGLLSLLAPAFVRDDAPAGAEDVRPEKPGPAAASSGACMPSPSGTDG